MAANRADAPAPGAAAAVRELIDSAPLFSALGDRTRIELLARLAQNGPESITKLSVGSALSRQSITKHLVVLAGVGLVRGEMRGREHVWQLDPRRLADARAYLERISRQWDAALERLRAHVED